MSELEKAGHDTRGTAGVNGVRVAVVDGDPGFVQVLSKRMDANGWEYRMLSTAVPIETVSAMRLNALVIDLATLGAHATGYLERLCERLPGMAVIVCSGPSTVAQRVRGLRIGADDWVNKPAHPDELIARVEAVLRRRKRMDAPVRRDARAAGELSIRSDQFQAFVGETSLDLTRREFELLELLSRSEGLVLEREEIYQRVWGYAMVRGDRSVDVFVRKLRQKLESGSPDWRYIHTHFGVGYRFLPEFAGEVPSPDALIGDAAGAGQSVSMVVETGTAGVDDLAQQLA